VEQLDKPKETQLISESAGLFKAETYVHYEKINSNTMILFSNTPCMYVFISVAKGMVSAAIAARPPFSVTFGLEGWLLGILSTGMSPVHGLVDALCQILFMGLFRFISLFFLMDFRRVVSKARKG
jgi:hypothetical protein